MKIKTRGYLIMNFNKIEADIQALIDSGKITNLFDLNDVPIDEIEEKYHLCAKELLCYICYKENCNCKKCGKIE